MTDFVVIEESGRDPKIGPFEAELSPCCRRCYRPLSPCELELLRRYRLARRPGPSPLQIVCHNFWRHGDIGRPMR